MVPQVLIFLGIINEINMLHEAMLAVMFSLRIKNVLNRNGEYNSLHPQKMQNKSRKAMQKIG